MQKSGMITVSGAEKHTIYSNWINHILGFSYEKGFFFNQIVSLSISLDK